MKVAIFGTESYDREFLTAANADVQIESHGSRARRWRGLPRLVVHRRADVGRRV